MRKTRPAAYLLPLNVHHHAGAEFHREPVIIHSYSAYQPFYHFLIKLSYQTILRAQEITQLTYPAEML